MSYKVRKKARKGDAALRLALAAGKTMRDAAAAAGISEKTATRRMADANFRRQVAALRNQMLDAGAGRLAEGVCEAADVLRELLHAKSESIRLGAARALLEMCSKLRESLELEERIVELEERLHAAPAPNGRIPA
jgi:hypothetical protein